MRCSAAKRLFALLLCSLLFAVTASAEISLTIGFEDDLAVGRQVSLPILLNNPSPALELGGFDFVLWHDPTLILQGITPGSLLDDCGWEYFNVSAAPLGATRVVAIAEVNNGPHHPDCYASQSGELAVMHFMIPNDSSLMEQMFPVQWYWIECGDNGVSSRNGQVLWLSRDVYAFDGAEYTLITGQMDMPTFLGAPDECLPSSGTDTVRFIDFYNGGIDVGLIDTIPPVITCPADTLVYTSLQACSTFVWFQATATDDNEIATILYDPPRGSSFTVGEHDVRCIAVDTAGNTDTCTFLVTVADTVHPKVICPGDIFAFNDPDTNGATVAYSFQSWDNCPDINVITNPPPGSFFPIGSTQVVIIVTDPSGNYRGCFFDVFVEDTTSPVVSCPTDIGVPTEPGVCGAIVSYAASATDNNGVVSVTLEPPSETYFEPGTHPVLAVAGDPAGNVDSCVFHVTVRDFQPPSLVCPEDIHVLNDSGLYGAMVSFAAEVSDNCPGVSLTYSQLPGSFFPVGTTLVEVIATDTTGNADSCTFMVQVDLNDPDGDGRASWDDNCPETPNADQADADDDGVGDVCDHCTDCDHDGFAEPGYPASTCESDNCPLTSNPDQADADGDGIGDACDECTDPDHDGYASPGYAASSCPVDNCPEDYNPGQEDADLDGLGDACCCWGNTVGNIDNSANGEVTIGDLTVLIDHLFVSFQPVGCKIAANVDGDPETNLTLGDLTVLIDHLFV